MNNSISKKVEEILSKMSLKDKIGQLSLGTFSFKKIDEAKEYIKKAHPGALIITTSAHAGNDVQENVALSTLNEIQKFAIKEMGIPLIFGRDVIHGHNIVSPIPLAMAASFNTDLIKRSYSNIKLEAMNDGIHWAFTPMLDVSRDPRWGRVIESPGEDPYVGERFATAVVEGIQGDDLSKQKNLIACAKHYIAYGLSEGGRDYHKAEVSDYNLRNHYLRPFKAAVKAGVKTVMSSFNEVSGQPVTSSKYLLTDVLKDELQFGGFIVSDYSAVRQLKDQGVAEDDEDSARLAINAGLDMDMASNYYHDYLEGLVLKGLVSEEQINDSVRRILTVKFESGIMETPYIMPIKYDKSEHRRISRTLASESMVLLKNNGVLPLKKDSNIALYGPMAKDKRAILGSWTLDFDLSESVSLYEGICNTCTGNVITSDFWEEMRFQSQKCDVVVLALGESNVITGEARSIANIELTDGQKEMVKRARLCGKPVVGVLCFGRPMAFGNVLDDFDAVVYAWHGGSQTGNAVADILFGDINPSGKMPITIPRCSGQIPIYYNTSCVGIDVNGYYGKKYESTFVSNYEDCEGSPLYPFGYGISYTEFEYNNLKADKNVISLDEIENGGAFTIEVNVKNIGSVDGKEVVQCYIRDCCASMARPIRELKGFEKVNIKAGKEKTVSFKLGFEELGFYNGEGKFVVEKGKFNVYVGTNCLDVQSITVSVI